MPDARPTKANGLLGGAVWNMLSLGVAAVAGFITMPVVVRGIGTDNYGAYSIVGMIGGLAALQDLGLGEATLRFVARYHSRNDLAGINRVLGATLSVYVASGTVCSGLLLFMAPWIISLFKMPPELVPAGVLALRIASVGFLFCTVAGAVQRIPESMLRYDIASKVGTAVTIIRSTLMIVVVKLGYGIVGLAWLSTISAFALVVVHSWIARRLIRGLRCWPSLNWAGTKEVFSYGIFSFANSTVGNVALYVDRFILGMYFGPTQVAYLSVPRDLVSRVSGLVSAAGAGLFPRFSRMEDRDEEMTRLYVDSTWSLLCMALVLFVPFAVIMPEFLSLWISPEFSKGSARVAQLIVLSQAVMGATVTYFAYLKGTGKVHWLTVMTLTTTGFSIAAAVVLVKLYGLTGAGIRVTLMSWTGLLLYVIVLKKGLKQRSLVAPVWRSILLPLILAAGFAVPVNYLWGVLRFHGWISLCVGYPAMAGTLCALLIGIDFAVYGDKGGAESLIRRARGVVGPLFLKAGRNG